MRSIVFLRIFLLAVSAAQAATLPLNDTGSNLCINTATNTFTQNCKNTGQDGEYGRDATLETKTNTDGRLGFSFRKICHSGEPAGTGSCPINPMLGSETSHWGCTQDLVTGLIWEIKAASGLRKYSKTYTHWGNGAKTDASGLVAAVNQQGLCGASDWRLPTKTELQSIVDYSVVVDGLHPAVVAKWFPRTPAAWHWTSDGYAGNASIAWVISFNLGYVYRNNRSDHCMVRLVRTGQ